MFRASEFARHGLGVEGLESAGELVKTASNAAADDVYRVVANHWHRDRRRMALARLDSAWYVFHAHVESKHCEKMVDRGKPRLSRSNAA